MKIETEEQFKTLANRWLSLQQLLGEEPYSEGTQMAAIQTQIEIERAMMESPFEFDVDDNVIRKENTCARPESGAGTQAES